MTEGLLLATTQISTFDSQKLLTRATGFFFEHSRRLFLVTSRHVVVDEPAKHFPDRIEIDLHTNGENLAAFATFSIPLYRDGKSIWRQGMDGSGEIDVAVIEIERDKLPAQTWYTAFTPEHLYMNHTGIEVGSLLLIVGFPLGFHDTLHHLPVVRQSVVASSFGMRFQGQGFFLTDARTHRGISGAAVVARSQKPEDAGVALPWVLLGVHSSRFDVGTRDLKIDEALGLNCAWYADILIKLTE
ncbi:MAG: trypsin-like peptidase domain-containing protein [Rudaea sp.]